MSILLLAALILYLCRLGGFVLPPIRSDALRFVPVAVFAALTVSPLLKNADFMPAKLVALFIAGAVVWRTRQLGVAVVVGFVVLKLLRLLI